MKQGPAVKRRFPVKHGRPHEQQVRPGGHSQAGLGRTLRISRLMALAIRFDQLIRDGVVTDQTELARIGQVSRARLTQVMNLSNLAPEIQEFILYLPSRDCGRERMSERHLRPIVAETDWRRQRPMWANFIEGAPNDHQRRVPSAPQSMVAVTARPD
jgi:hypothetical protein